MIYIPHNDNITSSSILAFLLAQAVQPFLETDTHEPMFTFSVFLSQLLQSQFFTNVKK